MPTIAVYKDGKKVAEHIASETGTASFQKVLAIHHYVLAPVFLYLSWACSSANCLIFYHFLQVREIVQLALL